MAREYGEFRHPDIHRLTVDAYAAQHPGLESRQSIQSVAIHLIGLYLWLEKGLPAKAITIQIGKAVKRGGFYWLTPPQDLGTITIRDICHAADLNDHIHRVQGWAHSVWSAWQTHTNTVKQRAEGL